MKKDFIDKTKDNSALIHCFDDVDEDIDISSKRWLKIVNALIKTAFRKIRIGKESKPCA
jgi:hypothetical protein